MRALITRISCAVGMRNAKLRNHLNVVTYSRRLVGQEVKSTLKFGFQVYRQFVCEEGFQDFCVGPILIANHILISPQFRK